MQSSPICEVPARYICTVTQSPRHQNPKTERASAHIALNWTCYCFGQDKSNNKIWLKNNGRIISQARKMNALY